VFLFPKYVILMWLYSSFWGVLQ